MGRKRGRERAIQFRESNCVRLFPPAAQAIMPRPDSPRHPAPPPPVHCQQLRSLTRLPQRSHPPSRGLADDTSAAEPLRPMIEKWRLNTRRRGGLTTTLTQSASRSDSSGWRRQRSTARRVFNQAENLFCDAVRLIPRRIPAGKHAYAAYPEPRRRSGKLGSCRA
jgi:hypothetical protein